MIQAICSAGVVTTFDLSLKEFKKRVDQYTFIEDTNGWLVSPRHIVSATELAEAPK